MPLNQTEGILLGPAFQFSRSLPASQPPGLVQDACVLHCRHAAGQIFAQYFSDQYTRCWLYDFDTDKPFVIPVHLQQATVVMIYNLEGDAVLQTGKHSPLQLLGNQYALLSLQPDQHSFRLEAGRNRLLLMQLGPSIFSQLDENCISNPYEAPRPATIKKDNLGQLAELEQTQLCGEIWQLKRQVLLLNLLFKTLDDMGAAYRKEETSIYHRDYPTYKKVKDYITQNIDKKLSIQILASRFGIQPTQLRRGYKKIFHHHLADHIRELRLERARKLLAKTELPVHEIAWEVGYESAAGFSRVFSNHYKLSPSDFRREEVSV
ncbi:helix-turn-helix domain-containing protein [Chitinophaga sp. GCM10012297]|uniref:Helix-turn-helix transcriptional regulator n=1 Tax=Chitinophaga chungangae TaxID=2821488 RepID=A0ABS3YJU9_9BACT|nr:AraC family transcriptional regulator [Chitinophaga chungangae]MBO9154966.1 helix-turn-helix transcriptional regulator [Chitinophaga chungangae]